MRAKETFTSLTLRQNDWEHYCTQELEGAKELIAQLGFTLHAVQPQIAGERYLMSGYKLVLFGTRASDQKHVVIKVSSHAKGSAEIAQERDAQQLLSNIHFAQRTFFSPEEILFLKQDGYTIRITAFIQQDTPFLARPLEEQFFLALRAFETQEGVQATTYDHARTVKKAFGVVSAEDYIATFETFGRNIIKRDPGNKKVADALLEGVALLRNNRETLERYSGFLTHHDLSLHNLRIVEHAIYLLDHTSIYVGNKYEGWARFLNFMLQYNPALEELLMTYVRENRGEEEYLDLRLMRIFKLALLLDFYTGALEKTEGNLRTITQLRIAFWTDALSAILKDTTISKENVARFREAQEQLRTPEEKNRNKEALDS